MEKRRGASISVKMIATSTLLILVIVALFGILNVVNTGRVFDEQAARQRDSFVASLQKRGLVQTKDLVQSSRGAILNNDYTTLQGFVPDIAKDDPEVDYVLVADKEGVVLAHSDPALNGKPVTDTAGKEMIGAKTEVTKEVTGPKGKEYVFGRPILQDGQRMGTVVLAYSLKLLDSTLKKIEADKEGAFQEAWIRTALIGLFFVLVGTALAIFQGLRISRPLKMLAWRADQIARGDLETRVEISSADEIGMLGENFNYMADRLLILMRETAEKATLEKELEVARTIQETLVPPADLVTRDFIHLAGYFLPASQCGGDWWTVHDLPDGRVLVVIGDVTGHGVPSAMITAAAKAACDVVRATEGSALTVTKLLEVMNRAIFESAKRKFVMTCFASILDPKRKIISYANAGHNFPYLFRPGATGAGGLPNTGEGQDFQVLMSRGNRLGDLEESTYQEKTHPLQSGDVLVWYTDGIVECENDRGEEYGEKRFRAAIRRASDLDPIAMRESVVSAAGQFFGERARKDDITMVFARITA
ncbi:MAG: SpoIIE family protein phosphatase [Polyangia bacterium]|jgi:serine phosphatase RsbU (regulator of sigma subunit)